MGKDNGRGGAAGMDRTGWVALAALAFVGSHFLLSHRCGARW
jgi:hypothetical protein